MMNAGTSYGSIDNVIDSTTILLPTGKTMTVHKEKLNFSYRQLSWGHEEGEVDKEQPIILDGSFCLHPSDSRRLKKDAETILKNRKKKQPTEFLSAGCFFKNPPSGKTAGELIEMAGLKGKEKGGAQISVKHANFIINQGKASAADILALMELIQESVLKLFNIDLEAEVKIVGE